MKQITVYWPTLTDQLDQQCRQLLDSRTGIAASSVAGDPQQLLHVVHDAAANVLLLDMAASDRELSAQIALARRARPRMRVLLLAEEEDSARLMALLAAGARGFLLHKDLQRLPRAIAKIHAGEAWLPREYCARLVQRLTSLDPQPFSPGTRSVRPSRRLDS